MLHSGSSARPTSGSRSQRSECLRLLEEGRVARLDIEHQQHPMGARHAQVAADRRVVLAHRVVAAVARLAGHDRRYQLERSTGRPRRAYRFAWRSSRRAACAAI